MRKILITFLLIFLLTPLVLASQADGRCGPFQAEPANAVTYSPGAKPDECSLIFLKDATLKWGFLDDYYELNIKNFQGKMDYLTTKDSTAPQGHLISYSRAEQAAPLILNLIVKDQKNKLIETINYTISAGCQIDYNLDAGQINFAKQCIFWRNNKTVQIITPPLTSDEVSLSGTKFVYDDTFKVESIPRNDSYYSQYSSNPPTLYLWDKGKSIGANTKVEVDGVEFKFFKFFDPRGYTLFLYKDEELPKKEMPLLYIKI
ncbi:hypothetical protein HY643_00905, partial [Candidatus Woesearchaeota archaeon]|nr:hypothetical protein [Candidatus Woesearchaeota archaeon]